MINSQMLRLKGACAAQVELFQKLFPDGATLTVENALSVAPKFNWDWAAQNLLTRKNRDAYVAAVKPASYACNAAMKPVNDAYDAWMKSASNASTKPARDARDAAVKFARDAYNASTKPANDAGVAVKLACDARDAAKARVFAELYIKQEQTK